jgi:spermidine synthase
VNIFKIIELIIICFSLVLPFVFIAGENLMSTPLGRIMLKVLFLIIPFLSGSITGSQFPLGNFLYIKLSGGDVSRTAGLLYASDLVGGWAGGIVGAVVLLPVLGLTGTCMTVGLMKLTSFIVFHVHSSSPMVKEGKNG